MTTSDTRRTDGPRAPLAMDDWVFPRVPYESVRGDLVTGALVLLIGVGLPLAGLTRWPGGSESPPVTIACVVAAAVVLMAKRRHPGIVSVAVMALFAIDAWFAGSAVNLALYLAAADALYSAERLGNRAERRVAEVVCAVPPAVFVLVIAPSAAEAAQRVIMLLAMIGLPYMMGKTARQRDALLDAEKARSAAERERAEALVAASDAERKRAVQGERAALARDLHDSVAAHLSAIGLQSGAAVARLPADADDATARALRAMRASSLEALSGLRQLIDVLNSEDTPATPSTIPPRITDTTVLEADAGRLGVALTLDVDVSDGALNDAVSRVLMRVARECVVNAARHAPQEPLTISVRTEGGEAILTAENPTSPQEPSDQQERTRLGLVMMAEQTSAVGGSVRTGQQGSRWVVRATVPRHAQAVTT